MSPFISLSYLYYIPTSYLIRKSWVVFHARKYINHSSLGKTDKYRSSGLSGTWKIDPSSATYFGLIRGVVYSSARHGIAERTNIKAGEAVGPNPLCLQGFLFSLQLQSLIFHTVFRESSFPPPIIPSHTHRISNTQIELL